MLSVNKLVTRIGASVIVCTLLGLSACRQEPVIQPGSGSVLEFDICPKALATLPKRGGYQGYKGWFYFNHDFWKTYPNLQEADFFVEMKEVLESQGIKLVLVPLPGVGMSNPEFLYKEDPWQAAFSPENAQADYRAFVEKVRSGGVEVVDALAAMQAYSAEGGYTFFKRDVHWSPDGANAVLKVVADAVKRVVPTLPEHDTKLSRVLPDEPYYGQHVNSWLNDNCGYHLPPEPLKHYAVEPSSTDDANAEVIQSGSSFSIPPYDVGFLSVWLQSPVYNASIGGGGLVFPLETYLRGDVYTAHKPKVIVWEFPISVTPIVEPQKRRLIASVYGLCRDDNVDFQKTYPVQDKLKISSDLPALASSEQRYLSFTLSDLKITDFNVSFHYRGQEPDAFSFHHPRPDASGNSGRFFAVLKDTPSPLESLELELPNTATGEVTVQLCQVPS